MDKTERERKIKRKRVRERIRDLCVNEWAKKGAWIFGVSYRELKVDNESDSPNGCFFLYGI